MFARGGAPRLVWLLAVVLMLTACNTEDDTSGDAATGQEVAFEFAGDVSAVDVEDVDVDIDASIGPDGIDIDPSGAVRVHLTVNLESINPEAAQLCKLQTGGDAILVVTDDTDLEIGRPLAELGTVEDESVTATGTARETAEPAGETPGDATDPAGTCELEAATLGLKEEPEGQPTPTPAP